MAGKPHVAVLKGGWSAEREVSLVSGAACASALRVAGFAVSEIDAGRDLADQLMAVKPDVVFNALHGRWGEDGCVQGLLEILGLPYTHSGVAASAMAMNKPLAKKIFAAGGIRCPQGVEAAVEEAAARHLADFPYVVKPAAEGSSVGVHIVRAGDNRYPKGLTEGWTFGPTVLVEEYIPGKELSVGVMGGRALTVTEILTSGGFYDYEAKYSDGGSHHVVPADLPPPVRDAAMDMAARAYQALGCRGVGRADFRFDPAKGTEGLYLLEMNTQPGMTPTSLVPEQADHLGMDFASLVSWMVEDASCAR